jgi:methylenetetrahydrofolate reductase (NADPH)
MSGALALAAVEPTPHPRRDNNGISVSFEFFPPKTAAMEGQLRQAIERLAAVKPAFMSVTCGAGGSTREGTHQTVNRIQTETGTPAAAHLTCAGVSRTEIRAIAETYWTAGIRHVVALRGDPPPGGSSSHSKPDEYQYASELVRELRRLHPFEISVAAYPETHTQAASAEADLDALKRKADAGATRAITQFFFDVDAYARFVERAQRAGIRIPIVPGILPVTNFKKAVAFAKACSVSIPAKIQRRFEGIGDDPATLQLVAAMVAAEQCQALSSHGVRHFHFYTLNRAEPSFAVCHLLDADATFARPAHALTNEH